MQLLQTETIQTSCQDGILTLTLNDKKQSANTMRAQFVQDYASVVQWLIQQDLRGVILCSAKPSFFAGGDLKEIIRAGPEDAQGLLDGTLALQAQMCALETWGKPVVAVLEGTALGGGLELALACHHRIAVQNPKTRVGLPEVTLGLLPGGGGTVRTVRMLGVVQALMQVLLKGPQMRVDKAHKVGLIDVVTADSAEAFHAARAWIDAHPSSTQPWRRKGYRIPGGGKQLTQFLPAIPATLKSQLRGADYHAPQHIMSVAINSARVPIERAWEIEARAFTDLVCNSPQSKNMTQAFFFDLQGVNKGASRPAGIPRRTFQKVAVIGAGMMGAGIAYVCAKAGMEVVLKDIDLAGAEKGKAYSAGLVAKAVTRGRMGQDQAAALLDRIQCSEQDSALAGCDLLIEAVFESSALKARVFQSAEPHLLPDALIASNTSTLPITGLAESVSRPADFVGLHFFSPVDKMPLVEIVRGEQSGDSAVAWALDFVQQIRKTPIVVGDGRGFFTSRVISCFLNEAVSMLGEGLSPVMIEQAGAQAGYPSAPLQLVDELSLTLPLKIMAEYEAAGHPPHPAKAILQKMVDAGRTGRAGGAGFYDYADGNRQGLWPGLWEVFGISTDTALADADTQLLQDLMDRMLYGEAIETLKCIDEGVLLTAADGNIGSILGIGFPAWTGGVVQFMDQVEGGFGGFAARCQALEAAYGPRFALPPLGSRVLDSGSSLRGWFDAAQTTPDPSD